MVALVPEERVQVSARLPAPAGLLYALVSDITRMGEWSPENVGGRWRGGATGPMVGVRFRGTNRRGWRRWSTNCRVTAAQPGMRFEFEVAVGMIPASRWTYEFEPAGDETLVTETWTDLRPRWLAVLAGLTMGVGDIRSHNQANMAQTLSNLDAAAR